MDTRKLVLIGVGLIGLGLLAKAATKSTAAALKTLPPAPVVPVTPAASGQSTVLTSATPTIDDSSLVDAAVSDQSAYTSSSTSTDAGPTVAAAAALPGASDWGMMGVVRGTTEQIDHAINDLSDVIEAGYQGIG